MCQAEPGGSSPPRPQFCDGEPVKTTSPKIAVAFFNRASRVALVFGSQTCWPRYSVTSWERVGIS